MGQEEEVLKSIIAENLKKEEYKFPKGFYKDLKYKVRVEVAGESIDTAARTGLSQLMIQLLSSNPAIFQDKVTRRILANTIKNVYGLNPYDILPPPIITGLQETITKSRGIEGETLQRGGSIALPRQETPVVTSQPVQTGV
jgi:hypothetical protein